MLPGWREGLERSSLRTIEFSAGHTADSDAVRPHIRRLLEMRGAGLVDVASIHLPFFGAWNPSLPDAAARKEYQRKVAEFIRGAAGLGARNFTIHGSQEPILPEERAARISASRESILELAPVAESVGASLNVEVLPRTCLGNTAEEMAEMLDGMPESVGVCFDVNHLCGHPEKIGPGIRLLSDRLRACHISDYDGVDECHWHPGLGVIDWHEVMTAVGSVPHEVLLIFEITALKPPVWQNREMEWRPYFAAFERDRDFLESAI